jgi:hypothetical protein
MSYLEPLFCCIAFRLNHRSREKGRELPPNRGTTALPSALAVEPKVYINDQHTNFQFGKLWKGNNLILVVNFFLALRGDEIPNKTDHGNI